MIVKIDMYMVFCCVISVALAVCILGSCFLVKKLMGESGRKREKNTEPSDCEKEMIRSKLLEKDIEIDRYKSVLKKCGYFPENVKDVKGEYLLAIKRTYHCCSRCRFREYGCQAIERPRRTNVVNDCKFFDFDDSYLNLAAAYERVRGMTRIETGIYECVDFCDYDFKGGELLARSEYGNNLYVVSPNVVSCKVNPEHDVSPLLRDEDFRYVAKREMGRIERKTKALMRQGSER